MKLFYLLLIGLFISGCKKEIVHDLARPHHLLTTDIYLYCKPFQVTEQDYITFTLNNATNCITIERPSIQLLACNIKASTHYDNITWYELSLCNYNDLFHENTELKIYLSRNELQNNLASLSVGAYEFHKKGNTLSTNSNVFKMRLIPLSQSWTDEGFRGFTTSKTNIFESDKANQTSESYFRITEIEKFMVNSVNYTRFYFEFSCQLQDTYGRNVELKNGSAALTYSAI